MQDKNYHEVVSDYYDKDANLGFENRAGENPLLERIRNDFRRITVRYSFHHVLEIGCGPGFDVAWFAEQYPEAQITGVDISAEMVQLASTRIHKKGLNNAKVLRCDERELTAHFTSGQFDLIYVYFGALNTVTDLGKTALTIEKLLKPQGHAVLTFVNKWYLREMIVQMIKINFKQAFARIRKIWGGYSPERYLPSRCYSPRQVKRSFKNLQLIEKQGYSIFFPAWYNFKKALGDPARLDRLWRFDKKLQKTCLWSKGEYTLFVFRKNDKN
jgi:SAM-dependent methyltransferase